LRLYLVLKPYYFPKLQIEINSINKKEEKKKELTLLKDALKPKDNNKFNNTDKRLINLGLAKDRKVFMKTK
jgi:hypothetical protein